MKRPLRLLIIEDSENDAALAIRQLEKADYVLDYHRLEDLGELEVAIMEQEWDLIISDYQLPGFTGADAMEVCLNSGKDIPFILISGTVGEETAVGLMKLGVNDYLLKDNIVKLPAVVNREITEAQNRKAKREAEHQVEAAHEAVRQSEAKFRAIYDNMFQFIGLMTPEGMLLEVNQAVLDLAGISHEDIVNQLFWKAPWWRKSEANRQQLKEAIAQAATGQFVRYEVEITDKYDQQVIIDFSIRPIRDYKGQVTLLIPEGRDITATRRANQELQEAFEMLSSQNKRLMNFSYIISHNLRSHTSSITSILNYLDDCKDEEERGEMLDHLRTVADSLDETMHNLNDVVSIQTNNNLNPENLNLYDYASRVLAIVEDGLVKSKGRIYNLIQDDVVVAHNPAYLESILLNFLSNAIRYAHPERRPEIKLSCSEAEGFICLSITDNGIGIDLKKNGEKLFGMYKTFSNTPGSKGLGLFITKNQVEALGGKIEVESELGIGTTFKIFFKK